ncbi:MAG: sigma 54-interacting transcriptional regulator [Myxococcaceae bacterium]|nr:sigma 54-interacting transcriptional regulator [Myxococcaceae bacterium]
MPSTQTVRTVLDPKGGRRLLDVPALELAVVGQAGSLRRFSQPVISIGSADGVDFRIEGATVSAVHCELRADERGLRVVDLESKNGTLLGGRRVQEAWLEDVDELQLGQVRVSVQAQARPGERSLFERNGFGKLKGGSWRMRELYALLEKAAASEAPVLLTGETGTGKELAADAIVQASARKAGPLVVVDGSRLTPDLADSELFGHEKGAFTGAASQRLGAFERAHQGTLFLDEVGELSADVQARLLGVLERKRFTRVGGTKAIDVDVRVISATHRRLEREVNRGTFRADLFFRLSALHLSLPPLRERAEDILGLVSHFVAELGARQPLPPAVLESLCARDYPGNVRELRNAVERAVLGLEPGEAADPSAAEPAGVDLAVPFRLHKAQVIDRFERAYVTALLEAHGGNVTKAAQHAGLNRVHLHEIVRRLGLGT